MLELLAAGSTTTDPVVLVGGGGLLAVCIAFTLALMRQARNQYKDAEKSTGDLRHDMELANVAHTARVDALLRQIDRTEARERACNRRVDILIIACRQNGVTVPDEVWKLDG